MHAVPAVVLALPPAFALAVPEVRLFAQGHADVAEARRHAVNTVIQGTAADLLKLALIRLHDGSPDEVRTLLCVHDSVLVNVPEALVEETQPIVREAMETVPAGFAAPL